MQSRLGKARFLLLLYINAYIVSSFAKVSKQCAQNLAAKWSLENAATVKGKAAVDGCQYVHRRKTSTYTVYDRRFRVQSLNAADTFHGAK